MRHLLISTTTLVALVACSSTDHNTGPSAEGADQVSEPSLVPGGHALGTRPLSGRCTTVVTRLAPPPIEVQQIEVTCRISHLGLTHAIMTQTVNVATGALSTSGVYVAANGDQVNAISVGVAVLSFTDPTDATVTFSGTQEFSPGTGRFADADGTALLVGTEHLNLITGSGTGEFTLDGTLTY